ncbi:protein NRT1/ PTR FAMILY 4.2-like [Asparagus officinalis]|uniref:protein NRT1/ PTR FAMILY 4.2-like n=1 Tax=Asparagus officinalis TaxID=4686 RepID=UPI00098E01DD|nr:protein NRT1/ PTR FAMILY 4.2-like [Asparagus officinalis]
MQADSMEATEKGWKFQQRKGGYRAAMFILVMTGLDYIGFVANMVSLVLYFLGVMHFDLADASTTVTNFIGTAFLLTILGGFISDTYMTVRICEA